MTPGERVLARCEAERPTLVSTDLFDTVLLRDGSTEDERFRQAAVQVAERLGVQQRAVHLARRELHSAGYRAVQLERPQGEARIVDMAVAMTGLLGLPATAASAIAQAEVEVEVDHLRSHSGLIRALWEVATRGVRVVAVSDTWYGEQHIRAVLARVVGQHPLAALHISSETGATKHRGGLYRHVAQVEGVDPGRILHLGDNLAVDVVQARAEGWTAEHLPRGRGHRASKVMGGLGATVRVWRR